MSASLGCAVITQAVKDLAASKWQIDPIDRATTIDFLTKPNPLLKFYCDLADLNMTSIIETAIKIQAYIQENGVPKGQGAEIVKHWGERLKLQAPKIKEPEVIEDDLYHDGGKFYPDGVGK